MKGVVLLTRNQGKEWIERDNAMLLGWSENPVSPVTTAEEEGAAGIITTFTMPRDRNGKVYAVWAADADGNGKADYEEQQDTPNGNKPTPPEQPLPEPSPRADGNGSRISSIT